MRPMVLLFVALFNSILGLSVLFPVLAPLGRQLGLGELEITSLTTAYALMQFLMSSYWGRRSEDKGRKPILLVGILGFAVSFYAFAAVATIGLDGGLDHVPLLVLLLASRAVGGAFSSATLPTAQAYAADLTDRKERTSAMAVIGAAFGLGIIFGPAIGATLSHVAGNLLAPVYFSATVAVLNAVFVAIKLPEPERRAQGDPPRALATVAKHVWPLLAIGMIATLGSVAMEQTIAFYFADRLGLEGTETARAVGYALVGYGVVAVISQGLIVRRFGLSPRTLLRLGVPIALAGFVLLVFARDYLSLMAALLLQGLGQGLLLPGVTAGISLRVTDEEQGAVAGLNGASQGLARTLGPLAGGGLYQLALETGLLHRFPLPYLFSAGLLAFALMLVLARPSLAPNAAEAHAEPATG